ncbi:FtsK/SpoIIIE domain-containing protein [Cellulomonas phragmiteti]|uniref:FtsK domain-containing protein n=1 Tax=Cellulomonas phragmiteti TaxID=478780 RepID=A0ABQ4DJR0_9CELL|nr:FtsK/SpoIIIE domain-containing protein [Cellulomonas phragmiteti]GIG39588.1 hypothetical protein Cph01nite_13500 [Cellulomonas phragmiteti]
MRVTIPSPVRPDGCLDVEVEPALPAGTLRRRLALLTGDARWAARGALLEVAGRVLDDHHPAGAPPLLPGAHLAPGPAPGDDVADAVSSGAHLAVLRGPRAGRLVPLPDGARVGLPLTTGGRVEVRRRGARVRVRVSGARGTMPGRPRRRRTGRPRASRARTVGAWQRTWPALTDLRVDGTTLRLRGTATVAAGRGSGARRVPPWAWTALASAAGGVTLAAVLRQPLLLLTAVTGLVGLLGLRGSRPTGSTPPTDTPPGTPGLDAPAGDVAALRLSTGLRLRDRAAAVAGDDAPWPADRTLALVGPRVVTLGVARALVLRTLGAGAAAGLVVRTRAPRDWGWTRWWAPSQDLPGADDHALVVVDGTDDDLGAWRLASPRAHLLIVLAPDEDAPAWATTVLRTGTGDPHEAVGPDVADAQGRAAAALAWSLAVHGTSGLPAPPAARALGELPAVPAADVTDVAAAWRRPRGRRGLLAPVGTGSDGRPVVLDLVRDGPHALVAGTTGAGKSELLTTLVLGLALTHPPRQLAVLLVDFKGGTGLGPLAGLPHVVDHVHDLDVTTARRTLVGLRAELRRREHLLAAAGGTDVADLDPADPSTPARLLVVVDELRALVDDLPDAAATLARLAAQGRALGVHLLLATQRPAGAVPADLRANVGLRIALRVADEEDSRDVVGCPDAAHLDVGTPGAALVRVGARPVTRLRVARARQHRPTPEVRLAPVTLHGATAWCAVRPPDDDVGRWVAVCREAAQGLPGTSVPWLPALPDRLTADAAGPPADPGGLLVALADVPAEQRRVPVRWGPEHGPLLVLGGPRSGRSTTMLTVAVHALLAGADVHAVGLPDGALDRLRVAGGPRVGTVLASDDVHRALLLLDRLVGRRDAEPRPTVLVVDGLDALLDALATHARGAGVDLLTALVRHPPPGVRLAAAGPVVPALSRLVGAFGLRLVLPVPDASLDLQAGVPAALTGTRSVPGRAVACTSDGGVLCQVVLPASVARGPAPTTADGALPALLRIGVLPESSGRVAPRSGAPDAASPAGRIEIGTGGDAPGPVDVDPARPLVVAGPPGSGRTTALLTLAAAWSATGRAVLVLTPSVDRPPPTRSPNGPEVVPTADGHDALDRLDRAAEAAEAARAAGADGGHVVLVDDVDLLERTDPRLAERLERMLATPGPAVRVVALATTGEHAAAGYRGPVAAALRARHVLVLDAHGPAAADLLGPGAALHADPRARPPGRGVLRRDRTLVRVQVHHPDVRGAG